MESRESFLLLCAAVAVLAVGLVWLSVRCEKLRHRLDLADDTFKRWQTNFNEFRGIYDALEKNIDATNERLDDFLRREINLPAPVDAKSFDFEDEEQLARLCAAASRISRGEGRKEV